MIKKFEFDKHVEDRGCIYTFFDRRNVQSYITFVQDKVSISQRGVIRGFHGDAITWKLITCLEGSFKLVVYDIVNQLTEHVTLNSDSNTQVSILVPPHHLNAHQCLTEKCIFLYKWSEFYAGPSAQWSVHYNDSSILPEWPIEATDISERDRTAPSLKEFKDNLT